MRARREDGERKQLQYFLIVLAGDGTTHTHAVTDDPITIGRSPLATICVAEVAVSRQHCVVTHTAGRLSVLDQGSANGTFVNGARVKQARLSHSDVIQVGSARVRVQAQTGRTSLVAKLRSTPTVGSLSRAPLANEQLELVQRAASRFATATSVEATAEVLLSIMFDAFPVDVAYVMIARDDGGSPGRVLASRTRDGEAPNDDVSLSVVERVIGTGQAERHLAAPLETGPAMASDMELQSNPILCAPLRLGGEVFGAVYLSATSVPDWAGTGEMFSLLNTLADVGALALGRARFDSALRTQERLAQDRQSELSELGRDLERRVTARTEVIEEQGIELAARLQELEHLQHSRATLARGLLHDINNLVGALDTNLCFLRERLAEGSEERAAVDDATESGRRILSMAKDVLAVSRMEEGTFPLATEVVGTDELIRDAVRRSSAQAREIGATLEVGPSDSGLSMSVDREVMGRVLDNLVGNALRYASTDGLVAVSTRRAGGAAEIIVADSGPGVPPEDRERIFLEWYSSGGTSSRHHGIGLYFCRLAVNAHGGTIRVEGEKGDNRFIVSLPALGSIDDTGPITVVKKLPDA